jgi:hypothetical protein
MREDDPIHSIHGAGQHEPCHHGLWFRSPGHEIGAGIPRALKEPTVLHRTTRPSSTAIQTAEVDATANWYVPSLGFRRALDGPPGLARMVVYRGGFLLAIDKAASDQQPAREQGGPSETSGVADRTPLLLLEKDVDAKVARLEQQGVAVVAEPEDALDVRCRVALVRNSRGRVIEVREPLGPSSSEPRGK